MGRFVALLRAVNVAGSGAVRMPSLCAAFASAGVDDVASILQSGNVTFSAPVRSGIALERRLEAACQDRLGLSTTIMVRSTDEWDRLVSGNPYSTEARSDPARLVAGVLKEPVGAPAWERLRASMPPGRERTSPGNGHLYIVYPDGQGRSKLTNDRLERALGTRVTCRNWNTVLRVRAQLGEGSS